MESAIRGEGGGRGSGLKSELSAFFPVSRILEIRRVETGRLFSESLPAWFHTSWLPLKLACRYSEGHPIAIPGPICQIAVMPAIKNVSMEGGHRAKPAKRGGRPPDRVFVF